MSIEDYEELPDSDFANFQTEAQAQFRFNGMLEKMKRGYWIYFDEDRYLPMEKEFQNHCREWLTKERLMDGWYMNSKDGKWGSIRALSLGKLKGCGRCFKPKGRCSCQKK